MQPCGSAVTTTTTTTTTNATHGTTHTTPSSNTIIVTSTLHLYDTILVALTTYFDHAFDRNQQYFDHYAAFSEEHVSKVGWLLG